MELSGQSSLTPFSYDEAFSRNIGWITAAEQQILRHKRVAIAGMGGVGGVHLLCLTRLGIGAFHIADFDVFELANFNRQAGATTSSLGKPKTETMARMARDINPTLDIQVFPEGIEPENFDAFLEGVDIYVDSLDFFALDVRAQLIAQCHARRIPVVIAAPIGMGAGYLVFMPGGMTFEQYFRLEGLSPAQRRVNFLLGLTPGNLQRSYLMDPSRVDLAAQRAPSTVIGCELCAGAAAAEVTKILLKRGRVRAAPHYCQFDAYRGKFVHGALRGGNRNWLQRIKLRVAYRLSERLSVDALRAPQAKTEIETILEAARWSPSGDNVQPWRFEIVSDERVILHLTFEPNVYDYADGTPTWLAAGFLLEALAIAASGYGRSLAWALLGSGGGGHRLSLTFARASVEPDRLLPYLDIRSVDRRAYRRAPLTSEHKTELAAALGPRLELRWLESSRERWQAARINAGGTDIRLRIPETYPVHRRVIDTKRNFSPTGIPVRAIGFDPLSRRLLQWLIGDWRRMDQFNRIFGTTVPRLEMDLIPGWFAAAHFLVSRRPGPSAPESPEFLLQCGRDLHRFWLTATRLGLAVQPNLAPLCFADYAVRDVAFTEDRRARAAAKRLAARLDSLTLGGLNRVIFQGRIGEPRARRITARSIRRDLHQLLVTKDAAMERFEDRAILEQRPL